MRVGCGHEIQRGGGGGAWLPHLQMEHASSSTGTPTRQTTSCYAQAQGKATRAGARQREEELGRRLAALEAELGQQREACEAATGTLSRLRSILLQGDRSAAWKRGA